ncbi:MAG TPA: two-component regulator propeller domain-containing protein [Cyclobacteriaceae bacterium]|nr:two-component regulator propeller domain-containing protein [Cyclobacteriaceae bacterium]
MFKAPLLFTFLCIAVFALSQEKPVSFHPSKPLSQSSIDQWTGKDGLISNNLTSVVQASDGFLWITTYNGLLKFDGYTFTLFDRENVPFLQSDAFYRGYVDGDRLWFTTQGSGIILYENKQLKPFMPEALPKSIRCLLVSENREIWAGSNNNGIYLVRDSAVTKIPFEPVKDISIMSLAQDQNKNLWVATNGNGVIRIKGDQYEQFTTEQGLSGNVVNTIRCNKNGDVLIGTTKGFDILSKGKITTHPLLRDVQVNSMTIDPVESIWLATERGLARINFNLGLQEFFTKDQGLPTLELTSIAFDVEHSAWITSSKAGLIRLKDGGITTFSETTGLSLDLINIIAEGPAKKMYIGTDGGDIDIMSGSKVEHLQLLHSHKNMSIRDICFDKTGTMWIGSYNGVLKKKGNQETLFNTSNGLPAQDVRRIVEGNDGYLWFATRSGGIIKFKDDKTVSVFDKKTGLRSNYVLSLEMDATGNIYAGTNGGGLSKIDPDGHVTTFNINNDDSGLLIFNVHIDTDGSLWLVTNTGLFYFDGKNFTKIEIDPVSRSGSFFDWVEDNIGNVWLTTNKGILRFKKSDVIGFVKEPKRPIAVRVYDNYDGMKNKECTGATRSLKSSDGEIWIPTIGGASVVYPSTLRENPAIPPVYITQLATDEKALNSDSLIEIEPGNLRYTFSFTSLSLVAPSKNQFKYRLEGFDDEWVDSNYERQVGYTNLPPGSYTFRVIASNNDGLWNTKGASISFSVLPYFYQRTSFYVFSSIAFLLILFGIYKWRIYDIEKRNRELRKVNSELDKFVYSASHDLRAPLASVLGLVAIARLDDGKERDNHLNLIEKSILKLDGFISDIIDFSRNARLEIIKEEINFEKLIHDAMDDLKYLDDSNSILRIVNITGQGSFYTDPRRLKIILSNLISNAIKYHTTRKENPFIEVKVERSPRQAVIQVVDNGMGIGEQHLNNIFKMFYRGHETTKGSGLGLYIVKETVEKIEGTIRVISTPGEGSCFTITLPSLKD